MRWLMAIFIFVVVFISSAVSLANQRILSFKEWKSERLQIAIADVVKVKTEIEIKKQELFGSSDTGMLDSGVQELALVTHMKEQLLGALQKKLNQSELQLETVKRLSVNDYFVVYLINTEDKKEAIADAAKLLSPDEVAQLLVAYSQHIN